MKKRIVLGAVGLVFGLVSICLAATSIRIAATLGETHQMNVALSRMANSTATPTPVTDLAGTGMDFGTLTASGGNFTTPTFFYIDAPVVSNKTGWTITHTATDFANSAGNNLNLNTNVTFMKAVTGGETALANNYTSYNAAKTRTPITQAELTGGWLRIYYGLANGGTGDASGVSIITTAQPTGSYVGTVILTLSP